MRKALITLAAFTLSAASLFAQSEQGTAAAQDQRVQLSAAEAQRLLIHKTAPVYPDDARAGHVMGNVLLSATIDKEGKVTNLQVVSGPPMLRQAAMDCAQQWTYHPYLVNGDAILVDTTVTVTFIMMH